MNEATLQNGNRGLVGGLMIGLGGALLVIAWLLFQADSGTRSHDAQEDVHVFFRDRIEPLITECRTRNAAASGRAIEQLQQDFRRYGEGVDGFANDVTSWGTRAGIVERGAKDLWAKWWSEDENSEAVELFVTEKYEAHIVSAAILERDVQSIVYGFQQDLSASRNRLYSEMRLALRTAGSPADLSGADFDLFCAGVNTNVARLVNEASSDTVVVGLSSVMGGIVAQEGVRAIVAVVFTDVASSTAASVAGSSATAASTGAGGAGGSSLGPAGTVVGIGVGLVVGAMVDWWMTEEFKDTLTQDTRGFLDVLETQLIDGTVEEPGLQRLLADSIRLAETAQREAIVQSLLELQK